MADTIEIAQYLFARLQQLRVQTVFGVPGDLQFILIDEILKSGLKWAGSANELIASYAAEAMHVSMAFVHLSRHLGPASYPP
ncbi:hypothetical protein V8C42DRAFT_361813 [Trichoderma barbatum]